MFTSPSNFILKRKKTLSQKPVIHVDSLSSKCVIDKDKELRLTLKRKLDFFAQFCLYI